MSIRICVWAVDAADEQEMVLVHEFKELRSASRDGSDVEEWYIIISASFSSVR